MPVYNTECFVGEAIESILNQTFTDFEFIIIDDGSTDNTRKVIQSYGDERIRIIKNDTNIGNYPSRNKGIEAAKTPYIAIMDADDMAMPERLEKQYSYFEKNPDLVALGTDFEFMTKEKKGNIPLKYEDICFSFLKSFGLLHPSLMIRTNVLRDLNGCQKSIKSKILKYYKSMRFIFWGGGTYCCSCTNGPSRHLLIIMSLLGKSIDI